MFQLALLFALAVPLAHAQVVDLAKDRLPITEINGLVRFHTGDDLRWSEPGFDNSQWPLVRIDQRWTAQGFQSDSGFAWYRFQIVVPPGYAHLGLYAPGGVDSHEIFITGQLVARYGGIPPTPKYLYPHPYVSPGEPVPDKLIAAGRPVEVALRVWHWPYRTFTPPGILALSIGDARLLETQRGLRLESNREAISGWSFLAVACLLGLCAGVGLFLLRRGEFEYLWFAGGELGMAALACWFFYPAAHAADFHLFWIWQSLALLVINICWPTFFVTSLREPRRRLCWATVTAQQFGQEDDIPVLTLTFAPAEVLHA